MLFARYRARSLRGPFIERSEPESTERARSASALPSARERGRSGLRWRRSWIIAGGSGAILLSAGIYAASSGLGGLLGPSPVATIEVARGRFVREVTATGVLKAVRATPLLVPIDIQNTQKVAWLAKDGSLVKAGDPVVLFDPTDMNKELTDGRADRESADNKIAKTEAENIKNTKGLELDRDLARQELTHAAEFAPKNTEIFSRNAVLESEIDQKLLEKRSGAAEDKLSATRRLGSADVALGQIERSKAEIRIHQAEKGLGSLRVLAPHDGLIVLEHNWRGESVTLGETVWPGQKMAEIPDLGSLEAKVYVLEADAGGLESGRAARVSIEGRTGYERAAKVTRVDAIAKTREWRSPTRYFETILTLDATDPAVMKPGQAVRARIVLEDAPDQISVPRGAIFEKDGKRVVYRMRGRGFEPVEVTVGHHSLSRVVIEKGLAPGDRIALRDPSRSASEIFTGAGSEGRGKAAADAGVKR